jgi:hypothetical protein
MNIEPTDQPIAGEPENITGAWTITGNTWVIGDKTDTIVVTNSHGIIFQ